MNSWPPPVGRERMGIRLVGGPKDGLIVSLLGTHAIVFDGRIHLYYWEYLDSGEIIGVYRESRLYPPWSTP